MKRTDLKQMIRVNQKEAFAIRREHPESHVTRTCKQCSKKKHYYATLSLGVAELLSEMRNQPISEIDR